MRLYADASSAKEERHRENAEINNPYFDASISPKRSRVSSRFSQKGSMNKIAYFELLMVRLLHNLSVRRAAFMIQ